jgi:predicted dienelactone hydrolase
MSWRTRLTRAFVVLVMLGILAAAALFTALSVERASDVELPAPTGPFAVGRAVYDWRDDTTVDPLAPNSAKREILAWVWYPAVRRPSFVFEDYLPADMRAAAGPQFGPLRFVTHDVAKVHAHSVREAAMPAQQSFPVVILRGGLSAQVTTYTTLAEDLASHGYVVTGIDAPYRTSSVAFPDGRVIKRTEQNDLELYSEQDMPRVALKLLAAWTSDIGFALDRLAQLSVGDPSGRFTGRLDMTRVGVFGHSFGGAQAAQFCHDDARCRAAIDIDGLPFGTVIQEGMRKPFMFLMEGKGNAASAPDAEVRQLMTDMRSIYDRLPPDTRLSVAIRGANHFTFSDDGAVLKSELVRGVLRLLGMLRIEGRRQLQVTAYCVRTFFDAYLKQGARSKLNLLSPQYPELEALDIQ